MDLRGLLRRARPLLLLGLLAAGSAVADELRLVSGSRAIDAPLEFLVRAESTSSVTQYQVFLECDGPASGYVTLGGGIVGRFSAAERSHFNKEGLPSGEHAVSLVLEAPVTCTAFGLTSPYYLFTEVPPSAAPTRLALAAAQQEDGCARLPDHATLQAALREVVDGQENGGFGLDMWATLVDRDGLVCAVASSGEDRADQWPGSRAISAQKANTANAFSLPGLALSTANLYSAVQPGGSLYGLQHSNPVDPAVVYAGPAERFGQADDPMVGQRPGGVNVFGGGLALYAQGGLLLGAIGVSGDTSCTDHVIAWRVRDALELDHVPAGVSPTGDDNIVFDIEDGASEGGWGHPACGLGEEDIAPGLPDTLPDR